MSLPNERHLRLSRLPKVDEILSRPAVVALLERLPRWAVVQAVRDEVAALRDAIGDQPAPTDHHDGIDPVRLALHAEALLHPSLGRVLNATGVVLHTNLGRAPLAKAALARMAEVAAGYCNLEYRIDDGARGSRHDHVGTLLAQLTGAESALVVNNGAGAVLLALAALASGRGVVVSRGELVEIGGSFRVPDVMRASGCRLVEVGCTNRTHLADYAQAIDPEVAVLMKVHPSNFAQLGFVADVSVGELAKLARSRNLRTLVDLGSGALVDVARWLDGAPSEPTVGQVVAAGVDLVAFSGDKLLGGPQAGILVGTELAIATCRSHPLMRALRPDKLCIAALEGTLDLYRDQVAEREVPVLRMLSRSEDSLKQRAVRLCAQIDASASWLRPSVTRVRSAVGGGTLPLAEPWSWAVALTAASGCESLTAALRWVRAPLVPVVARVAAGRVLLDLRTVDDEDGQESQLMEVAATVVAVAQEIRA